MSERVARDAAIWIRAIPWRGHIKLRRESAVGALEVTLLPVVRSHSRSKALWATKGLDLGREARRYQTPHIAAVFCSWM
jgi:hypothetical protein